MRAVDRVLLLQHRIAEHGAVRGGERLVARGHGGCERFGQILRERRILLGRHVEKPLHPDRCGDGHLLGDAVEVFALLNEAVILTVILEDLFPARER